MPGRLDLHVKKLAEAHRAHVDAVEVHAQRGAEAHQAAQVDRARAETELLQALGVDEEAP